MTGKTIGQEYQKISGTFYNNSKSTVSCGCSAKGLLSYVKENGETFTMILCFDTEPGSFYEIFNGEKITVEGNVKNTKCSDGQSYLVLYVIKSKLPISSRKEIMPAELKLKQNILPAKQTIVAPEATMQGFYVAKGSTRDDWSNYKDCDYCGRFEDNRSVRIIFDGAKTYPSTSGNIKVWGTKEENNFYVTKWQGIGN